VLEALAGANLIYGAGMIEGGMTWSHEQLVIDDEIIRMVKRVIQGIDVTDETIALEIIENIHETKNYLHEKHTLKHMRTQSAPQLFDRTTRNTWESKGAKDLTEVAREKAHKILQNHHTKQLADDTKSALRTIVKRVEKERLGS